MLNLTPCVLPVIPIKVMTIIQHANRPGRNLVLGLWMALGGIAFWVAIGLPCFGFVAGALLAGAATLPPGTIMVIFTALGVGMASPYLALSLKPALVEKLPRTGPASELVKQVMGLLLLAAGLIPSAGGVARRRGAVLCRQFNHHGPR